MSDKSITGKKSFLLILAAWVLILPLCALARDRDDSHDIRDFKKKWRLDFYLTEKENTPGIEKVKLGNLKETVLPNNEKVYIYEKPFLGRRHYGRVESQVNSQGIPEITIRLNWRGRNAFKEITSRNIGKAMLVYWGKKFLARAYIVNAYRYGDIPITGDFDYKTARKISDKFKYKRRLPRY